MSHIEDIKIKVEKLIDSYEPTLRELGIKCTLSQKYREEDVEHINTRSTIIGSIERRRNEKKEKERYFFARNKYKVLILTFSPLNKKEKRVSREYGFYLEKTTRAHLGEEPQYYAAKEEDLLKKIENRIQRIAAQAQEKGTDTACSDNLLDMIRYTNSNKYLHKERILGKSRNYWSNVCTVVYIALLAAVFISAVIIINSFR